MYIIAYLFRYHFKIIGLMVDKIETIYMCLDIKIENKLKYKRMV